MSLATRCTHCDTIFKVVQDQLKVSEGWVRCGRCHEVFNAMPSLFDLDSEVPPPRRMAPAPAPVPAPIPSPPPISAHTPLTSADLAFGSAPLPATTEFDLDTSVHLPASEPPEEVPDTDESDALDSRFLLPPRDGQRLVRRPPGPEFADAQFPSDVILEAEEEWAASLPAGTYAEAPTETSMAAPNEAPAQDFNEPAPWPVPSSLTSATLLRSPSAANKPQPSSQAFGEEGNTQPPRMGEDFVPEQAKVQPPPSLRKGRSGTRGRDPSTQTPEFVKRAQRQAFWRHPATRGVLLTMLLGLTLGLCLQLAHQFRDLVVAYAPEARPLMTAWCDQVGCQIKPPLRMEVLQVDSATLLRTASEGPDRYRLTVSVHNRSDIDVAWPHLDLSLTDERGAVIARRAFQVSDARQGATLAPLPAAVPQQQSTTLQWSLKLDKLQPAGYTAELFYP